MKNTAALFLLVGILASVMLSCGTEEGSVETPATDTHAEETTVQDETGIPLGIPAEDNGGKSFRMLIPVESAYEFTNEYSGDVVNDAIYDRNLKTEEHFNIKFDYQYEAGNWDQRSSYMNFISNSVLAEDIGYDLVTGWIACTIDQFVHGYFMDLTQIDDLHLDNAWWIQGLFEELNVNDALYTVLGDLNLSVYKNCEVIYFNKTVQNDFQLEDPYTLVRGNQWTMDKMLEMSLSVVQDLNGDGVLDPENDLYGIYMQGVPYRGFQTAMDVKFITTDEDGNRCIAPLTERMVEACGKVSRIMKTDGLLASGSAVDFYTFAQMLAEDRALFHASYLYVLEGDIMRNMKSDFGIVPYPKLDAEQESFRTPITESSVCNYIPINCPDANLSSRVIETLAYYSMQDVVPAYYKVALENKYTRDADVPEMLSLIRNSMTLSFDFAMATCFDTYWPNLVFWNTTDETIASFLAEREKSWKKTLENLAVQ